MKKYIQIIAILVFVCGVTYSSAQSIIKQSEELGQVHWYRDYDKAVALSKKQNKDILILFQEVPGCSTCRNYGHNVLSSPLMVEAIENSFIPLAIFNNKGGKDREVLNKFNEPTWNNPVVRIVDFNGKDVVQPINRDYSVSTLSKRIIEALESRNAEIPGYINLLEKELSTSERGNLEEAHFKMYCFWTGEKQLGKVDGVVSTKSGFADHSEVVKVKYDPTVVDKATLENYAQKNSFKPIDASRTYRPAKNDIHYYLRHTDYRYIPLTELQQTKINSALGSRRSGYEYLSPKQLIWLNKVMHSKLKGKNLLETNFEEAWALKEKESMIASNNK
ncbi:VPGUxxT family thioredoxin-like (seleno)protein, type 2 [Maribacter sp. 2210JD10-5]|uniref:VPGUxxT family thioredoxin-like (seleno)protein, type 2 n=1 Tax=Maribacter sp. 2210JD10-5 TaxID=3386272 RepID=UPI0039BCFBF5